MFHSYQCVGLWSLGVIHIATASLSWFGVEASLLSVTLSLAANLIAAQCTSPGSCPLGSWLEQLGLLCWVSASCSALSGYLNYYDDLQHHSYLHLVPIDVFPRVMPLVGVFIISSLFALGLEASHFLNMISTTLFWTTFALFTACSLSHYRNIFGDFNFGDDTLKMTALGAAVWFSFTVGCKEDGQLKQSQDITISSITYLITLMMLSSLQILRDGDGGRTSLIEPLGTMHSWYKLAEVTAVSCCLGMAVYQLYLPALEYVAHKSFVARLSRESRLTGTKLAAVTVVGIYCCALVYLYSPGKLVLMGSAATLSARSVDSIYSLWIERRTSPSSLGSKKNRRFSGGRKRNDGYATVRVSAGVTHAGNEDIETGLLSCDSGHSSETDVDEIVQEYKMNSEVLKGFELTTPTKWSGIVTSSVLMSMITISLLMSRELVFSRVTLIPWYTLGLLVMLLVFLLQPTQPEARHSTTKTALRFVSVVMTTALFGVVAASTWVPLFLWIVLGAVLYLHNDIATAVCQFTSRGSIDTSNTLVPQLPAPKIEIRLQVIQIRNKTII